MTRPKPGAPAIDRLNGAPHGTAMPCDKAITCARASWPRCRALARSTGRKCTAPGDGVNGLCKNHTGLALRGRWRAPLPTWELQVTASAIWLTPSRPARTWRKSAWPQRVSWSVGVRLVTSAQVTRAVLHRDAGRSLLRKLEHCGVRVLPEPGDTLIRRYRFVVDDPGASTRLAKGGKKERTSG